MNVGIALRRSIKYDNFKYKEKINFCNGNYANTGFWQI